MRFLPLFHFEALLIITLYTDSGAVLHHFLRYRSYADTAKAIWQITPVTECMMTTKQNYITRITLP